MAIRRRGNGWQVRVRGFSEVTVPTRHAAESLELDLKVRSKLGQAYREHPVQLGVELDGFLERLRTVGGQRGPLSERSIEWYERSLKAWQPLRARPIPQLRRREIEDLNVSRAAAAPDAARDELQVLKQALRRARSRGQTVDPEIFEIPPPRHETREGKALTLEQVYELGSWMPEWMSRIVPLASFGGPRLRFWLNVEEGHVDFSEGTLFIPRALNKTKRDHTVHLTSVELQLFREQLLARTTFAKKHGLFFAGQKARWERATFYNTVWWPSLEGAGWKKPGERAELTFHDLRRTAASLMARAGIDPAVAAARLGHSDGGALFLRTYRFLYPDEQRQQVAKLERMLTGAGGLAWS
ncbi:MAG TPA: tyrosine-type recombinase/integrase [Gaiellaceae bacterium]|jgi:integrase|nr:tyrosine-type recombinase/integrase [Gaiellaceae bacterium]